MHVWVGGCAALVKALPCHAMSFPFPSPSFLSQSLSFPNYLTAPAPREVMAVMWETAWRRPSTESVFISGLAIVGTLRTRTAHSSSAYRAPRPAQCTVHSACTRVCVVSGFEESGGWGGVSEVVELDTCVWK